MLLSTTTLFWLLYLLLNFLPFIQNTYMWEHCSHLVFLIFSFLFLLVPGCVERTIRIIRIPHFSRYHLQFWKFTRNIASTLWPLQKWWPASMIGGRNKRDFFHQSVPPARILAVVHWKRAARILDSSFLFLTNSMHMHTHKLISSTTISKIPD